MECLDTYAILLLKKARYEQEDDCLKYSGLFSGEYDSIHSMFHGHGDAKWISWMLQYARLFYSQVF